MQETKSRGFINIELLILIVISSLLGITILSAYISARSQARDKQRIADINAIQSSLQIYFNENGFYPSSVSGQPVGITDYLDRWPIPPKGDGCTSDSYAYAPKLNASDYALTFCLVNGIHTLSSKQKP